MFNKLYHYVDQYGLNTTKILACVIGASLIMLFAVREIFSWFMKTGKIAKQFKVISKRLEQIELQLHQVTQAIEQETEPTLGANPTKKNQFDVNH